MPVLDKEHLLSEREHISHELGRVVIDHVLEHGRADLTFVQGQLFANDSRDIVDLMNVDEDTALHILALIGASDEDMEGHLNRRETRDRTLLSPEDALET